MSYLSSNQLKQYEDEGFVSPINIFSKDKAKEIRNEIELIENNRLLTWENIQGKEKILYQLKEEEK